MRHWLICGGFYRHSGFAGGIKYYRNLDEKLAPDLQPTGDAQNYLPSAVSGRGSAEALCAVAVESSSKPE